MKRISTRFALLMAAAAVLPLLAYGAVSIVSLRTGARQAVVLGNQNVARQVTEQIDLYVTGSVRILKALAADLQQTGLERWQQDRIVKNFVLEFAEFQELTLIDDAGTPIVSSRLGVPTVTVPGSESVNVEGALMSRFSLDDDLLPTSIVAVRLAEGGWLVGRLNLEAMWRMVDRIRVGEQGYALVVTGEGQLLAHGNPDAKSRVARGDTFGEHPLITQLSSAPDRAQIASAEYEDERGPVLGVAARLPTLGWTVVVEQPVTEAFAIPIRMQTQLGIAISLVHDLSHPIQNIGNSCKLIVKMFDDVEYRESFKRTVERELAQVKRVLDDLRNVARPLPLERFPLDINKAILELLESMQTTAESAGLTIEAEPVFGPLYIEGDLFALNRVYRNLLMNAMQATPPHGRVVIRTLRQNEQAIIEVADTGCGIPAERLETIFDDFVTTKRRGLGLGLAISKKVVEQLGGTISVASEVGLGSTFTLRFPLTKARPSTKLAAV